MVKCQWAIPMGPWHFAVERPYEFPEFLLEKFRNFGTWKKPEFPEFRNSEIPELQSHGVMYSDLIYRRKAT